MPDTFLSIPNSERFAMTLKRLLWIMLFIAVLPVAVTAKSWDLQIGPEMLLPTGDFWSGQAWGVEARAVRWFEPVDQVDVGLGLSLGFSQWKADDQFSQFTLSGNSGTRRWSGKMRQIPLGISYFNRVRLTETLQGTLELGMRYVLCSSDVTMTRTLDDGFGGTLNQKFDVDCDNGVAGRIGGILHWERSWHDRPVDVLVQGGYQFDLNQGTISGVSFTRDEAQDLELGAFYVGIGLALPLQ
jgi:hypothetical protein